MDNFNKLSQKIFTQMDLDKFFEIILTEYKAFLPEKLQTEIMLEEHLKYTDTLIEEKGLHIINQGIS